MPPPPRRDARRADRVAARAPAEPARGERPAWIAPRARRYIVVSIAIEQRAFGEPCDVVTVVEIERREPGPGEVRVDLAFAPINPADLLRLRGQALTGALPAIAGGEGAGRVAAVGSGVSTLQRGDLVLVPPGGTWAEHVIARADDVIPLPPETPPEQAAMLSINPMTASCLLDARPLRAEEWIIQNAAGSAVGRLVARLAAARNVRVLNVVRDAATEDDLRKAGAAFVLRGESDLAARVAAITRGAPVVLGLDAIAGPSSAALASCLAPDALLVVFGLLSGKPIELPTTRVVFEGIEVRGFSRMRAVRRMGRDAAIARYRELAALVRDGTLASEIEATYPLDRVVDALAHSERAGRRGKILLRPTA